MDPQPFEIDEERKVAVGNGLVVHRECDGEMFRRRAIKGIGGAAYRVEYCVIKVDGTFIYVGPDHVIVSKEDKRP